MVKQLRLIEPVIGPEEERAVAEVLRSGWLSEGPVTRKFEELVSQLVGSKHAVAATSCTTAMEIALRAMGVGPGDRVLIPDFTHPATADAVIVLGGKPVLVDVDLYSYNMDFAEARKTLRKPAKAMIPVSWGGYPLNKEELDKLKREFGVLILEDAACSLGADYHGAKSGAMADITCFSFHPRKVITTGEGGMTITDDPALAKRLQRLRMFGMETRNGEIIFTQMGTNCKMSNILASIGVEQMKKIDSIINRRIELAAYYDKLIAEVDMLRPPTKKRNIKHTYQTYAVYVEKEGMRNKIIEDLRKKNIETQIGTYALHLQPNYNKTRKVGKLDRAEKLYRNLLALPMCHSMTKKDQELVVSEVARSLKTH